jgi:hypothetical protein
LQHQDDRPVRGGRPSLLSPDEQAAPERQGILSSLDGMPAPAHSARAALGPRPRSRALAWGVAAVGAIVAGVALFMFGGGEQRAPAVAVAAVADVPRAAPVTPVAMPAPAAPAAAVLRDEPAAPDLPMANPLAEMAAPAPERHKTHAAKAEHKEAHAKAAHRKAHETAQEKRAKPRAEREPDSDVVLLAALMSHMDPANRKATPAQQLEACRRYNAAGEEQCRARVCEKAGRKEAACRRVPVAGAGPET